jgi:hypothetical protein
MRAYMVGGVIGPIRPLSTGAMFPREAEVTCYDGEARLTLEFRVRDKRPVLTALTVVSGGELSRAYLHNLPFGQITDEAVRAVALAIADAVPAPYRTDVKTAGQLGLRARRRRLDDELLKEVAEVAAANPRSVLKAVTTRFFVSERTAARWAREARQRGLLAVGRGDVVADADEQRGDAPGLGVGG